MARPTNKPERPFKHANLGRLDTNKVQWVRMDFTHVVIYDGEWDGSGEPGEDIRIFIEGIGKKHTLLNLSSFTEPELDAWLKIITNAVEIARPICQLRDKNAQEAWDSGDTTYKRMYRGVPRLIIRPRSKSEHGAELPERPDQPDELRDTDDNSGLRPEGSVVAERGSQNVGSQDDGSSSDQPSEVRSVVPGTDADAGGL